MPGLMLPRMTTGLRSRFLLGTTRRQGVGGGVVVVVSAAELDGLLPDDSGEAATRPAAAVRRPRRGPATTPCRCRLLWRRCRFRRPADRWGSRDRCGGGTAVRRRGGRRNRRSPRRRRPGRRDQRGTRADACYARERKVPVRGGHADLHIQVTRFMSTS
jgi:hypothetical protein